MFTHRREASFILSLFSRHFNIYSWKTSSFLSTRAYVFQNDVSTRCTKHKPILLHVKPRNVAWILLENGGPEELFMSFFEQEPSSTTCCSRLQFTEKKHQKAASKYNFIAFRFWWINHHRKLFKCKDKVETHKGLIFAHFGPKFSASKIKLPYHCMKSLNENSMVLNYL